LEERSSVSPRYVSMMLRSLWKILSADRLVEVQDLLVIDMVLRD
jgi:hypothetical protein